MPRIKRELIRTWLEDHNWSIGRLARECSTLGEDTISTGTMRNVVNGIDPVRPGRIKLICRVLAKYGDGIPYEDLVEQADETRTGQRALHPCPSDTPPSGRLRRHPPSRLSRPHDRFPR